MAKSSTKATEKIEKKEKPVKVTSKKILSNKFQIEVKKQKKAKKDKNAPKKAISSFIWFTMTRRAGLKIEMPNLNNKEIISKMSKEWGVLTAEEKIPYVNMASNDKIRNLTEKAAYEKIQLNGNGTEVTKQSPCKAKETKSATKAVPEVKKPESEDADADDDEDEEESEGDEIDIENDDE